MRNFTLVLFSFTFIFNTISAQDNRQKVVDAVTVPYSASKSMFMHNRIYTIGTATVGTYVRPNILQQDLQLAPVGYFFEELNRPFGPNDEIEFLNGIVKTSDNHIMVVGSYGVTGDAAIWVMKMDTLENIIWDKNFKTSNYQAPSTILPNDHGGFLMAGHLISPGIDPVHLLNVDFNGDTLWTRKVVNNLSADLRVVLSFRENNGDYVIGNRIGYNTELVRFDPNGNLVSNYTYSDGAGTNLVISGGMNHGNFTYYYGYLAGGNWTSFIMKTDNNGNVIWCKNYNELDNIANMKTTSDGNLMVYGKVSSGQHIYKALLMKLDTAGNPLIAKSYGQLPYSHNIYSCVDLPNGKSLFTGERAYQVTKTAYQIVVDNDLNSGSCYEQIFTTSVINVPMNKVTVNNVTIQPLAPDFTYIGPPAFAATNPYIAKVDYDVNNSLTSSFTPVGDDCGGSCNGSITINTTGGNPGYTYLWDNGQTGTTATGLCGGDPVYVRTKDQLGCTKYDTLLVTNEAAVTPICVVSVDSTSTKNIVVWEKPVSTSIAGFTIYRDVVGTYGLVGYVPYDSLSVFIDNTNGINPNITAYRYKIKTIDTCGNESLLSDFHKTIHLTVNQGFNNNVNLIWDNYIGFSYSYNRILRDSTGLGNWQVLDSVANNVFTWTDGSPTTTPSNYMIEVVLPSTCVATRAENHNTTRSNRGTLASPTGVEEKNPAFKIYPNPSSGIINISLEGINANSSVSIVDATGRVLKTVVLYPGNNSIDLSDLANGLYFIQWDKNASVIEKLLLQN